MAETSIIAGGAPNPSPNLVSCDQETIVGDGSPEHPLRVSAAQLGIAVEDDGTPVAGGPFTTINVTGQGATAIDAGDHVVEIGVPGTTYQSGGVDVPGGPHVVVNYTGGGVTASDAGGGVLDVSVPGSQGAAAILTWGFGTLGLTPAFAQGGWTNLDPSSLQGNLEAPVPFAGVISDLYARHNVGDGTGAPITYTLVVNGVDTALVVSVPTGVSGQAANTTDSVSVAAGDRVAMKIASTTNGEYLARISCKITPT